MNNETKHRLLGVDFLRGVAAFVVVLIHTPSPVSEPTDSMKLILFNILPPANAVFAVMAGSFMLEKLNMSTSVSSWLKSRALRLIVPYFVWTLFYILINVCYDFIFKKPSNFIWSEWKQWLNILFLGGGATHLWFLPTLFYAQFMLLVCRQYFRWRFVTLLVLGLSAVLAYPLIDESCYWRKLLFMVGYVFLGGCMVYIYAWTDVKGGGVALFSIAALLVFSFLGIPDCLQSNAHITPVFWVLLARSIIAATPSVRSEIKQILAITGGTRRQRTLLVQVIRSMGGCSMGIYLIHALFTAMIPIIIGVIFRLPMDNTPSLIIAAGAFFVSWAMVIMLKKFRVVGM